MIICCGGFWGWEMGNGKWEMGNEGKGWVLVGVIWADGQMRDFMMEDWIFNWLLNHL